MEIRLPRERLGTAYAHCVDSNCYQSNVDPLDVTLAKP
jgi:hypothetical protein